MLKNITVLVTGAAGSLGSATAQKLISEGCKVTLLDLPDSKGNEVAEKLGSNAIFSPGDVTSEEDVTKALELTESTFGNLRSVVNCAAVHKANQVYNFNKSTPMKLDQLNDVLRVNVVGTFNVIRLAVGYINRAPVDHMNLRGVVINTGGLGAMDGQPGQCFLAAAWGAIESLTLPLCREFGDRGIRVMTISPGLMDSNLTSFISRRVLSSFSVITPSPKRLGFKEEYADLVVTIMKNSFLNGEVIRLNGGLRLCL